MMFGLLQLEEAQENESGEKITPTFNRPKKKQKNDVSA